MYKAETSWNKVHWELSLEREIMAVSVMIQIQRMNMCLSM